MNWRLLLNAWVWPIYVLQVTYLSNIIVQDHRFSKKLTQPPFRQIASQSPAGQRMKGFEPFGSASATLDGIEVAH
ncbi:hypothetical protein [Sedimentitalea nanhaiensis]|uniref:Putative transposase n=1 Tax=Sedimentitalea nanhaiensis TaxID=999627 RepID=A0A1I7BTN0_9RHOB|nr:hypothetical protein [Sedimentitalea nanhaiensis]SFT90537.1 putative transposase [Sedimentitalea nanhaiensis]